MSVLDPSPSTIPAECTSCKQVAPFSICYCDAELCATCTPGHLSLCQYAKVRKFRTWIPRNPTRTKRTDKRETRT
jgi:hypothetical protein